VHESRQIQVTYVSERSTSGIKRLQPFLKLAEIFDFGSIQSNNVIFGQKLEAQTNSLSNFFAPRVIGGSMDLENSALDKSSAIEATPCSATSNTHLACYVCKFREGPGP
jgi:hypothetical protein